jgi:hypothetical protein
MSGIDRDTNRIVRAWLDNGVTAFPDRLLDEVLTEVSATRQRRSGWPAWRFSQMNPTLRIALAGAALAVAVLGGAYLLSQRNVATPNPTASPVSSVPANPTSTPAAQAEPLPFDDLALAPGRYTVSNTVGGREVLITFALEDGWTSHEAWYVYRQPILSGLGGVALNAWVGADSISAIYPDPCHRAEVRGTGSTVEDLVSRFMENAGAASESPTDVAVSGFVGKELSLGIDPYLDPAECDDGHILPWDGRWVEPNTTLVLRVLDVDGIRVVLDATAEGGASGADRTALRQALDAVEITVN